MTGQLGFTLSILALMLLCGFTYQVACEKQWYSKAARLFFKGVTTLFASLLAFYAYWQTGEQAALLMAVGILLCAIADVLLELNFLMGTACFAAGHLMYLVSFFQKQTPGLPSLLLFLLLASISTYVVHHYKKQAAFNLLPFYAYSLVIAAMVAAALAQNPLVFLGAALFAASDGIIARRLLNPGKDPWDRACIALYYAAQFILAATLLL